MSPNPNISVIVPLLNEEESLPELCSWIARVMDEHSFSYEVLLIDDGSTDNSWATILDLKAQNANLKGIQFNRNYGKSAALDVGFKEVSGDVVITMDADLQDSPDEIPELYRMVMEEDYDLVSGWKRKRFDPLMKTIPSKLFNRVARAFSGVKLHDFNCGLKAYKNKVVKSIDVYGEMHRYIPFIAKGQGFSKIGEKIVQHQARKYGTTKFGLERFIFGFLDLLSISFVSKFRKSPMHFFGSLGTLSFLFGSIITVWVVARKLYEIHFNLPARDIVAQPLFFLALVAIIIGVQLFLTGFIGEMMIQVSPKKDDYLISEKLGLKD
ncbi:Glycosyltransferase involved in cell wall bisynthesis [Reichenbachiella agariperforans]|uniref:Glycosyltransferase involved in cell wall bisynthesis n=1 Tax=Reichenbachiella agariperforans TaxID=156994 RepID=A0A1M6QM01_REIAG|nr:glycosyltransferase family 2 protein [Reichenbachiella agariperforans]SHK21195.1 Glycosyltransferase involved in cell wall bisynthesis [Reichenbachiella agariperforans]